MLLCVKRPVSYSIWLFYEQSVLSLLPYFETIMKRLLILPMLIIAIGACAQDKCGNISLHGVQGSAFGVYKDPVQYKIIQMEGIYSQSVDLYLSYYPIIDEGELYINFSLDGIKGFNLKNEVVLTAESGVQRKLRLSQFIIDGESTNEFKSAGKRVSLRAKIDEQDLTVLGANRIVKIEFAGKSLSLLKMYGDEFRKISVCVSILAQETDNEFNNYKAYEHLKRPKSERMFMQTNDGYISANGKTMQKARQHGIGIEY